MWQIMYRCVYCKAIHPWNLELRFPADKIGLANTELSIVSADNRF